MVKKEKLITEFGIARIRDGYWTISSRKEGNHGKRLHRLIFEKAYGPIPDGYDIHHINEVKTENNLENLELMEHCVHSSLHNSGKTQIPWNKGIKSSKETCEKLSKTRIDKGIGKGEKHHNTDLTDSDVVNIIWLLQGTVYYGIIRDIAALYNVNRNVISKIKNFTSWKHIPRLV